MSKLACNHFRIEHNGTSSAIKFLLYAQGDWQKTPEGYKALEKATEKLSAATQEGALPANTSLDFNGQDGDVAAVEISYPTRAEAMTASKTIKDTIAMITGAVVVQPGKDV